MSAVPTISKLSLTPPLFGDMRVAPAPTGGRMISWEMACGFNEPLPHVFQLQVGRQDLSSFNNDGAGRVDDWTNVGSPTSSTFYVIDTEKRLFGKTADLFYRIQLTTGNGQVLYSDPVGVNGHFDPRDAYIVEEMIRKEKLRNKGQVGVEGYLLKAYRYGPPCPVCTDPVTGEVTNSHCITCYGTGFQGGYFQPLPGVFAVIDGAATREALNPQTNMSKPVQVMARMLAQPMLNSLDVFVEKYSNKRHFIHTIKVAGQHKGIPIILQVELRLAPYSDVIYSIPI